MFPHLPQPRGKGKIPLVSKGFSGNLPVTNDEALSPANLSSTPMTDHVDRQSADVQADATRLEAALPLGTTVLTLDGAVPVESLLPGDRVITRDAGAQPLRAIVRRRVPDDLRLVQLTRRALGGKPDEDIVLLPQQRILIRDWRAKALYGAPQAKVAAARMIDGEYIRWSDNRPGHMIALHFMRTHIIYACGLELLSANPHFATGFGAQ